MTNKLGRSMRCLNLVKTNVAPRISNHDKYWQWIHAGKDTAMVDDSLLNIPRGWWKKDFVKDEIYLDVELADGESYIYPWSDKLHWLCDWCGKTFKSHWCECRCGNDECLPVP